MPVLKTSNVEDRRKENTARNVGNKDTSGFLANLKEYTKLTFISSLLTCPLDLNAIPNSYAPPIIYLFLISFVNISLLTGVVIFRCPFEDKIATLGKVLLLVLAVSFVLHCLLCFVFSVFSSKIIRHAHTAQQFGLNASSFTYLPVAFFLRLVCPGTIVSRIGAFGVVLLMTYYIENTYALHYSYPSPRIERLHHIFIFLIYYGILLVCLEAPGWVLLSSLISELSYMANVKLIWGGDYW